MTAPAIAWSVQDGTGLQVGSAATTPDGTQVTVTSIQVAGTPIPPPSDDDG